MKDMPVWDVQEVCYTYPGGARALIRANIGFEKGLKTVVLGSNGAGKSSLFMVLTGLLKPLEGLYLFNGEVVEWNKGQLNKLRRKVGIVFQDPDTQLFAPTVFEEVSFGLANLGFSPEDISRRVTQTLQKLEIEGLQDRAPHLLSFGQKKKVAMASVIAMDPEVLIFDEPLSGLDPVYADKIIHLLDELSLMGKTLIVSTHNVDFAWGWAQRALILKDGRVANYGPPEEILIDSGFMQECGLRPPIIVEVLERLNLKAAPFPRSLESLSHLILAKR